MGDDVDRNALLAHFERATSLYKGGRLDESIEALQAALKIDPKHAPSRYNLALRLESKGRYAEAVAEFGAFLGCASKEELQHEAAIKARIAGLKKLAGQASTDVGKTLTMGPDDKSPSDATKTLGPSETKTLGPAGTMTLGDGVSPAAPARGALSWRPGDVVDGLYEVREVLGEGGFGSVHKVWHRGWRMELAVKAPLAEKVANRRALERFVQEANAWVGLGLHPNVVACYFVRVMGVPRIFIEYMPGGSLADWIAAGRTKGPATALDCAIQIARGMDYVHRRGLVHRDLKPGNCLMAADGTLKVTDFGLVKVGEADDDASPGARIKDVKAAATVGGLGTPEYMAPEQWTAPGQTGKAADVWAFGAILYELLCGKRPFGRRDGEPTEALRARLFASDWKYDLPRGPIRELDELVVRCLSKDPSGRPADFSGLVRAMEAAYAKLTGYAYARPAAKESPILADTLVNQGVSMADLGRDEEAQRLFGEALKLDPVHAGATYNQGLMELKAGRGDGNMLARLEALRRAQSRDWIPAYLLALVVHLKGRDDEAKKLLMEARQLGMGRAFAEVGYAGLFVALPKGTEAAQRETAEFERHMAMARELQAKREYAQAYEEVKAARSVSGYERADEALGLARELGATGTRTGLRGGWQQVSLQGSEGAAALELNEIGGTLTSRHEDGTFKEWGARTGARLETGRQSFGAKSWTEARTADGRYVVSGRKDGTISVVDLSNGREVMSTKGHAGVIKAVALSADGGTLYTAGADGIRLWGLDWEYSFGDEVKPRLHVIAAGQRARPGWKRFSAIKAPGVTLAVIVTVMIVLPLGWLLSPRWTKLLESPVRDNSIGAASSRALPSIFGTLDAKYYTERLMSEAQAKNVSAPMRLAMMEAANGLRAMAMEAQRLDKADRWKDAEALEHETSNLEKSIELGLDGLKMNAYAAATANFEEAVRMPGGQAAERLLAEAKNARDSERLRSGQRAVESPPAPVVRASEGVAGEARASYEARAKEEVGRVTEARDCLVNVIRIRWGDRCGKRTSPSTVAPAIVKDRFPKELRARLSLPGFSVSSAIQHACDSNGFDVASYRLSGAESGDLADAATTLPNVRLKFDETRDLGAACAMTFEFDGEPQRK